MPARCVTKGALAAAAPILIGMLLAVPLGAAAGCSSATSYRPLTVAVRDRVTQEPVAGAVVRARTVHFFVPDPMFAPFDPYPVLDSSGPTSTWGETGGDGTARFEVIVDHPVQLEVSAGGYEPLTIYLPRHPGSTIDPFPPVAPSDVPEWMPVDENPAELPRLQVRVR